MLFKLVIILFLLFILYALGSGLYYLVGEKTKKDADRVAKALTWRIGLSLVLFALLFIAFALGWITPHKI